MAVIVIEEWMIEREGLGGLELLAFAIIHGCTQKGDGCWHGGYESLAKRIGGSTRATIDATNRLLEKGYIKKGMGTINGRNKTIFMSATYAETSYEETSHEETACRPMQKLHSNNININKNNTESVNAYDDAVPQKENWRHLSSARKAFLGFVPDAIAEYKRELIASELSSIAVEIGMPQDAQSKFLSKWCEHNPGSDMIKADYEATFNVRDRAIQWMGWWKKGEDKRKENNDNKLNPNSKWGR